MNDVISERVAHCLSMDGMQAAKRHVELLEEGWQPRAQFYLYDTSEEAVARMEGTVERQLARRGIDIGHVAIDGCAIGYEQLQQTQHEEVTYRLTPGIAIWYPPEVNDAS